MSDNWTEEKVYPVDKLYEADTVKLLQYCKWFANRNEIRANDLSRDEILRAEDKGRADAYRNIVFHIHQNLLITKV